MQNNSFSFEFFAVPMKLILSLESNVLGNLEKK